MKTSSMLKLKGAVWAGDVWNIAVSRSKVSRCHSPEVVSKRHLFLNNQES